MAETIKYYSNYADLGMKGTYQQFAYFDTRDHLADDMFRARRVMVEIDQTEYGKQGDQYVLVFCQCRKRYARDVKAVFAALQEKLIAEGHEDYLTFADETFKRIQEDSAK